MLLHLDGLFAKCFSVACNTSGFYLLLRCNCLELGTYREGTFFYNIKLAMGVAVWYNVVRRNDYGFITRRITRL